MKYWAVRAPGVERYSSSSGGASFGKVASTSGDATRSDVRRASIVGQRENKFDKAPLVGVTRTLTSCSKEEVFGREKGFLCVE